MFLRYFKTYLFNFPTRMEQIEGNQFSDFSKFVQVVEIRYIKTVKKQITCFLTEKKLLS